MVGLISRHYGMKNVSLSINKQVHTHAVIIKNVVLALVQNIFIRLFFLKKKADVQNMCLFKMHIELFQIIKLFYFHDFVFINYHLTLSASLAEVCNKKMN